MHRGGWEWDRLLERYIDSERKDPNEIEILKAYLLSILDRYQEAKKIGEHENVLTLILFITDVVLIFSFNLCMRLKTVRMT